MVCGENEKDHLREEVSVYYLEILQTTCECVTGDV
jgi:hypothetical protein